NHRHRHLFPELIEARDPKFGDPARNDPAEMREVGGNVQRETVEGHPALHSYAERSNLGLLRAFADPDSDASRRPMRLDAQAGERIDHPAFERIDEAADISPALVEVEHHINDPLAGAVIG